MLSAMAGTGSLLGREATMRRLVGMLDRVPDRGGMVALVGEAGVGKSALQAAVVDEARARGFRVLTARGSESETHLPFASLHQVLRPLLGDADQLPVRQREALLSGFGMSDVVVPDRFLMSLAALELVAAHAQQTPVLLSLEDLHWMDEPSLDVVSFVARRVESEQVLLLASVRAGTAPIADDPSIEQVRVGALDDSAARALLAERAPDLEPALRERVLREAGGNPLALLEFPLAMASGRFGWTELSDELPMTTRLEQAFASRALHLPDVTRTVLTVAALEDGTDLAEVLAAAGVLTGAEVGADACEPALASGLLVSDGRSVEFGHPLVRSALTHTMPVTQRHAVHAVLAQVLGRDERHRDRAVWHRAAAADTPDEQVAGALEDAAQGAARRGALGSAVTWLLRAAALSPQEPQRGARLLLAAELAFELGRSGQVEEIRRQVDRASLRPGDRSRLVWLEGVFDDGASADPAQVRRLVGLAQEALAADDADLAFQLLLGAGRRAWWGEPGADVRHEIVVTARSAALPDDDPRLLAVLALAEPIEHGPAVQRALSAWADIPGPDVAAALAIAAFCVGDLDRAITLLAAPADALRSQSRLSVLAEALAIRSWSAMYGGDLDQVRCADEAMRLADQTGRSLWGAAARIGLATLGVLRGGTPDGHDAALLAEAEAVALRPTVPMSTLLAAVQLARGLAELGAGRHDDAYRQLRRVFEPGDPAHHRVQQIWTLGYLVDAAIPTGHRDDARALLAELEDLAGHDASVATAVALEYSRAVLADDASADGLFRLALDGSARPSPWHRARVQLAYGAWLRRHRRSAESRTLLRQARAGFEALGTRDWAQRADQELRASGEHGWRAGDEPDDVLSAQESEIARLAADGLSNREIAQRLYLSHRTVGSHLYRIFPKLGVTSRAQLGAALAAR